MSQKLKRIYDKTIYILFITTEMILHQYSQTFQKLLLTFGKLKIYVQKMILFLSKLEIV